MLSILLLTNLYKMSILWVTSTGGKTRRRGNILISSKIWNMADLATRKKYRMTTNRWLFICLNLKIIVMRAIRNVRLNIILKRLLLSSIRCNWRNRLDALKIGVWWPGNLKFKKNQGRLLASARPSPIELVPTTSRKISKIGEWRPPKT